jgi:hypothetical protein
MRRQLSTLSFVLQNYLYGDAESDDPENGNRKGPSGVMTAGGTTAAEAGETTADQGAPARRAIERHKP